MGLDARLVPSIDARAGEELLNPETVPRDLPSRSSFPIVFQKAHEVNS